jgi:hypothetical protein
MPGRRQARTLRPKAYTPTAVTTYKPLHVQVVIEHEGTRAEVDEALAPLLVALWRRGYRTIGSCQAQEDVHMPDAGGRVVSAAWIAFATPTEAARFARLTGGYLFQGPTRKELIADGKSPDEAAALMAEYPPGGPGVAFPSSEIQAAIDAVEGSDHVTEGGGVAPGIGSFDTTDVPPF